MSCHQYIAPHNVALSALHSGNKRKLSSPLARLYGLQMLPPIFIVCIYLLTRNGASEIGCQAYPHLMGTRLVCFARLFMVHVSVLFFSPHLLPTFQSLYLWSLVSCAGIIFVGAVVSGISYTRRSSHRQHIVVHPILLTPIIRV